MRNRANDLYLAPSCRHLVWTALSKTFTILIPNGFLVLAGMNTKERQQAWREKFTLFFFYLLLSAIFYFWLEFVTTLFCEPPKLYDFTDVFSNSSKYSAINGAIVDWEQHGNQTRMTEFVNANPHRDLSAAFPHFMLLQRKKGVPVYSEQSLEFCINQFNRSAQADSWLQHKVTHDSGYVYKDGVLTSCPIPGHRNQTGSPCFYSVKDRAQVIRNGLKGELEFSPKVIYNNFSSLPFDGIPGQAFVTLDQYVLDVTDYITSVTEPVLVARGAYSRAFVVDRMFLPLDLTILLFINLGSDITDQFYRDIPYPNEFKQCLLTLFFHGVIPSQKYQGCASINLALWITLGCFLLYILLKLNLAYLSRLPFIHCRSFSSNSNSKVISHWPYTILFIPFYSEPSETVRQTFDSLARTTYPDNRKLLLFVCDGLTQSTSDSKENYRSILDSLGYSSTNEPEPRPYVSLGSGNRKINYAKVYAGFYESGRNRVPFIMIVKIGSSQELLSHRSPGNRGKRDSMVIVLSFLERCMNLSYNHITPLEFELYNQCYNLLGIDPWRLKYMLVTDADTQVQADAVYKMVLRLEENSKMLAVSGHVRPANPEENVITMLQIIPNHLSYYSGMAYEACFNSVTSINGSFVMYCIWKEESSNRHYHENTTKSSLVQFNSPSKWLKVSDEHLPGIKDQKRVSVTQQRVKPICISPTALRSFAAPRPETMHMENILLLGEDHYIGVALLKAHPQHILGFESEAIAYTALPTNLFTLQAQQIRGIRACFHIQLEFQHAARYLGIRYWLISITKLIDYILSMPLTVYLYSIYIRYFIYKTQAYAIVAECFAGLLILHMFYFIVRRQFKYILWFGVYCLFSVPLFMVYFPLLAVWKSDSAYHWYDIWPISNNKSRNRLHGIVEDKFDVAKSQDEEYERKEENKYMERLCLKEFEVLEAEKQQQREREEAAMLDAKFNGFDNFVSHSVHTRVASWATSIDENGYITSFPTAHTNTFKRTSTVRSTQSAYSARSINSVRTSKSAYSAHTEYSKPNKLPLSPNDDVRLLHPTINTAVPHTLSIKSGANSPNPFSTFLEDPIGSDMSMTTFVRASRKHKHTKSQSSFFSRSSYNSEKQANDRSTVRTSMLSLSTEFPTISSTRLSQAMSSPVSQRNTCFENDNSPSSRASSIYSLSNSVISLEQETDSIPPPLSPLPHRGDIPVHIISEDGTKIQRILSSSCPETVDAVLGRSTPIHSKIT
ncbi:glycosyltransferase family 2 protein [Backusella circina FSU 941]|nr:glycosyltransferase family 2 protein [Backusella circina FSU 941]